MSVPIPPPHTFFLPRRLDKFVRDSTRLSAPAARRAIDEGRVLYVSGSVDQDASRDESVAANAARGAAQRGFHEAARLIFEDDTVLVDGIVVRPRQQHHTYVFNKPRGVTSTTRDPEGKRDLSEYLEQLPAGTFPVGRLDRETTGLLLFTTDGDLATAILRPEHTTPKTYWLWLDEELTEADPRYCQLTSGVELSDGPAHAAVAELLVQDPAYTELLLTLHTGRNRQIRRMCHALDLRLVHLHRKSIGHLHLGALSPGAWRELGEQEVATLWQDAGGVRLVQERRINALRQEALVARSAGSPHRRLESWLKVHANTSEPIVIQAND